MLVKTNFIYRKSLTDNIFNAIIVLQDKERGDKMNDRMDLEQINLEHLEKALLNAMKANIYNEEEHKAMDQLLMEVLRENYRRKKK